MADITGLLDRPIMSLHEGMIVNFMYDPVFGFDREYTCKIISLGKSNFVGRVIDTNPPQLIGRKNKRFKFDRMRVNSACHQKKSDEEANDNVRYSLSEQPYRDEHGMER